MGSLIKPEFQIEETGLQYIGRGPRSSGAEGWCRSSDIFYRCASCGSFMKASINDYFNCECGAMHLDIDCGRFGSRFGDDNILVYRKACNNNNNDTLLT